MELTLPIVRGFRDFILVSFVEGSPNFLFYKKDTIATTAAATFSIDFIFIYEFCND